MSREERVGGVEPETVTVAREDYVPPSAFRRVEEELRQAREERDAYRASWEREATDAARYRLHHEACVRQRDKARKAATGWVEDVSSMAARVDDMAGDLRACRAALDWYAKEDRYDVGRASSRPVVLADRGLLARRALAALSPVQGEHEQDGEDAGGPSLDEVYAERNKVVLAFAALVKEQGWDVGLTVDPDSPDWPVLMIETDAGQVSWHFQAGELPSGLPLFAGKWDGHSTPEKYARLAELVRSGFGLSGEIAQDGDTEETT